VPPEPLRERLVALERGGEGRIGTEVRHQLGEQRVVEVVQTGRRHAGVVVFLLGVGDVVSRQLGGIDLRAFFRRERQVEAGVVLLVGRHGLGNRRHGDALAGGLQQGERPRVGLPDDDRDVRDAGQRRPLDELVDLRNAAKREHIPHRQQLLLRQIVQRDQIHGLSSPDVAAIIYAVGPFGKTARGWTDPGLSR
jgi:hypothetical protein